MAALLGLVGAGMSVATHAKRVKHGVVAGAVMVKVAHDVVGPNGIMQQQMKEDKERLERERRQEEERRRQEEKAEDERRNPARTWHGKTCSECSVSPRPCTMSINIHTPSLRSGMIVLSTSTPVLVLTSVCR